MSDINIRIEGRAGRITLNRPSALNALTHEMLTAIEAALDTWINDEAVALVLVDASGDKAFCAGGDVQKLYDRGMAGDFAYGQAFWADEYRLNLKIFEYPKPVVSFLQGFTMGGGVGIGCHGSHRIVCESSTISMPECSIGLVPDVGGSLLLTLAPGRLGEYLAITTERLIGADAVYAGFADTLISLDKWDQLKANLIQSGDIGVIGELSTTVQPGQIEALQNSIDKYFGGETLGDIVRGLEFALDTPESADFSAQALKKIQRNSPQAMACAIEVMHRLRGPTLSMRKALELEYRFTYRAMEHGDFLEGIRAMIIEKDRKPNWHHDLENPPLLAVTKMLMPLGSDKLSFERKS